MSLGKTVLRASAWVFGGQLVIRLFLLVNTIIIARILTPRDFGVIALVAATREILDLVFSLGTQNYLIRSKEFTAAQINTAFTLDFVRALIVATATAVAAYPIAYLVGNMDLRDPMLVTAVAALIAGFYNTGMVTFTRDLDTRILVRLDIISQVTAALVTIAAALLLRSYWAFVIGWISESFARVCLSYVFSSHRPRLTLSKWREMMSFGVWLSVSQLLFSFGARLDSFVLEKFVTTASVGLFTTARDICATPIQRLVQATSNILYSAFSRIGGDPEALRRTYMESVATIVSAVWPLLFGLAVVAPDFAIAVLGPKWAGIERLISPIAAMMALQLIASNSAALAMQAGRTQLLARRSGIYLAVRLPGILIGTSLAGLDGAVIAYCGSGIFLLMLDLTVVRSVLHISLSSYLQALWRPAMAVTAMVAVCSIMTNAWDVQGQSSEHAIRLLACMGAGAFAYASTLFGAWRLSGRPWGPEARALDIFWPILRRRLARC